MQEIQGYRAILLNLYPKAKTSHTIFAKENTTRVKDPRKPEGRTLFLSNIPPYVTEHNLKYGFQNGVVSVQFYSKPPAKTDDPVEPAYDKFISKRPPFCFKVAYVVFSSTKSLKAALELESIDLFDEKGTVVKSGVEKWMAEYLAGIEDEDQLQAEIDEYMAVYDKKEQAAIEAEKAQTADDEGWVTVTKRGRNAGFKQKQSVISKLEQKMERSKKEKELTNFYTFQIRESKMQNIVSLRKKFEEDKKRIETLKNSRRFKPF